MGFWTWAAISVALAGGIVAVNSKEKKTKRSHVFALICFIGLVSVFFVWWFNR